MSCLATWKEGSSRYLVALMNHSHVYTDESRNRCFVYQRQRQSHHGDSKEAVYKMAQSNQASCLGLWSVDEGYKTFTLKKRELTRLLRFQTAGEELSFPLQSPKKGSASAAFPRGSTPATTTGTRSTTPTRARRCT